MWWWSGSGRRELCAAIEAARAGAEVVVLDRFAGGGATALSGGVVYAGGGTSVQRAAGITDSPEAMYEYLCREVDGVVSADTLRRFCAESPDMIDGLAELGVRSRPACARTRPRTRANRHYLYYYGQRGPPAGSGRPPEHANLRGHRAHGRGISGGVLSSGWPPRSRSLGGAGAHPDLGRRAGSPGTTGGWFGVAAAAASPDSPPPPRTAGCRGTRAQARSLLPAAAPCPSPQGGRARAAGGGRAPADLGAPGRGADRRRLHPESGDAAASTRPRTRGGLALGTPWLTTAAASGSASRRGGHRGARLGLGVAVHQSAQRVPRLGAGGRGRAPGLRRVPVRSRTGGHALVSEHGRSRLAPWWTPGWSGRARRQLGSQTVWFQRVQTSNLLRSPPGRGRHAGRGPPPRPGSTPTGSAPLSRHTTTPPAPGLPDPAGKPSEFVRALTEAAVLAARHLDRAEHVLPVPDADPGRAGRRRGDRKPRCARTAPRSRACNAAGRTAVGICSRSYVSGLVTGRLHLSRAAAPARRPCAESPGRPDNAGEPTRPRRAGVRHKRERVLVWRSRRARGFSGGRGRNGAKRMARRFIEAVRDLLPVVPGAGAGGRRTPAGCRRSR